VINFPNGNASVTFPGIAGARSPWYSADVRNNIIVNNVAGWDGAGVSLLDALNVNIINNTIMSNDSTASAGPLFDTVGARWPAPSRAAASRPQHDRFVSASRWPGEHPEQRHPGCELPRHYSTTPIICPDGHGAGGTGTGGRTNGACRKVSYPELYNDVFWQNRSFYIGVGALGTERRTSSTWSRCTTHSARRERRASRQPAPAQRPRTGTSACAATRA